MKFAQGTVVSTPVFWYSNFTLFKVSEQNCGDLMALVGDMKLKLVQAVGVKVTGIAPQLNRI